MFIVIEGLDGSGKSRVSKSLAKKLNAKLLSTPGTGFKDIRKKIDSIFENNIKARQLFYMATVLNVADEVRALKASGQNVVVDRYWLSTQVYHYWMNNGQHYKLKEVESELLKPDRTVYLDLSVDERIVRILERSHCTLEDRQTLNQQVNDELRSLYFDMCGGHPVGDWLVVDASQRVDTIVESILNSIHKII